MVAKLKSVFAVLTMGYTDIIGSPWSTISVDPNFAENVFACCSLKPDIEALSIFLLGL